MTPPAINVSGPQSLNLEPKANSEGTSFKVNNTNAESDVVWSYLDSDPGFWPTDCWETFGELL